MYRKKYSRWRLYEKKVLQSLQIQDLGWGIQVRQELELDMLWISKLDGGVQAAGPIEALKYPSRGWRFWRLCRVRQC